MIGVLMHECFMVKWAVVGQCLFVELIAVPRITYFHPCLLQRPAESTTPITNCLFLTATLRFNKTLPQVMYVNAIVPTDPGTW